MGSNAKLLNFLHFHPTKCKIDKEIIREYSLYNIIYALFIQLLYQLFAPNMIVGVIVYLLLFLPLSLLHVNFLIYCIGIETVIDRIPIFLFDISAFSFFIMFFCRSCNIFIGCGGDSFVKNKIKL